MRPSALLPTILLSALALLSTKSMKPAPANYGKLEVESRSAS
jgi:hypothetical protein